MSQSQAHKNNLPGYPEDEKEGSRKRKEREREMKKKELKEKNEWADQDEKGGYGLGEGYLNDEFGAIGDLLLEHGVDNVLVLVLIHLAKEEVIFQ